MSTSFPTTVVPCPLIEVVAEIIFNRKHEIEPSAVYGKVYDALKKIYPDAENMPIFQLPETIRLEDENFKNKPWHKFSNSDYAVLIGANVIAIVAKEEYPGWSKFFQEIKNVLTIFSSAEIVDSVSRVGLKYIDMFEFPIVNEIDISLISGLAIDNTREIQIRTNLPEKDGLSVNVGIMNNISIILKEEAKENVSLLDIDVFKKYDSDGECDIDQSLKILDEAHNYQKELFFSLAKKDFLEKNNYTVE